MTAPRVAEVRLWRNRAYNLLWSAQFLSELVAEVVLVAVPLLVLAHSESALRMSIAASLLAAANLAAVIPAGLLADRWDRRKLLLLCQGIRGLSMASLVLALTWDAYSFTHVLVVVVIEGVFGATFEPAEHAALPQVVSAEQLATAIARNTARPYLASLLGPGAAGFLFAIHPVQPFLANAVLVLVSFVSLSFLRLPRREQVAATADGPAAGRTRRDIADGFRWVLGQRVIRAGLAWVCCGNLIFTGLLMVVLARAQQHGVAAEEIGVMMGLLGFGGVLGAIVAARVHHRIRGALIIIGCSWLAALSTALMAHVPGGLPTGALLGLTAFLAPLANTALLTRQLLITPDALRGRLSGIAGFCSGGAGALGPVAGGVLLTATGDAGEAMVCAAAAFMLLAIGSTLSPTIRALPTTDARD